MALSRLLSKRCQKAESSVHIFQNRPVESQSMSQSPWFVGTSAWKILSSTSALGFRRLGAGSSDISCESRSHLCTKGYLTGTDGLRYREVWRSRSGPRLELWNYVARIGLALGLGLQTKRMRQILLLTEEDKHRLSFGALQIRSSITLPCSFSILFASISRLMAFWNWRYLALAIFRSKMKTVRWIWTREKLNLEFIVCQLCAGI